MTYGCKNRAEFKPHVAQAGWDGSARIIVSIPPTMAKACQYTRSDLGRVDPLCAGCKHKLTKGDV